jgi:PelA/Pel-15E family pectate lyase
VVPADDDRPLRGPSTFDNKNVWPQVDYLARVYRRTGLRRYGDAANRAIDYILKEQRDSGGWRGCDVQAITFNDFVMSGIMSTLKDAIEDRERYDFVGDARLAKVRKAYRRGLACMLACQVTLDGRLTTWGQQHHHKTLEPVRARTFEPAALTTAESAGVVRYLMSIDEPSPEVITAVQAAVAWFDGHKISGIRIAEVRAEPIRFPWHWCDFDRVEVEDPDAPPIWTRFYDLKEQKPLFCTRKRVLTRTYTNLSRERRTGYAWYGYWPAQVLEPYPDWQKKWAPEQNVLHNRGGGTAE